MRRGSRNLVPTILAAEAAIIGLLFIGHFTMPEGATTPLELTLADVPAVSSSPVPAAVGTALPRPSAVVALGLPRQVEPAPPTATALPVDPGPSQAMLARPAARPAGDREKVPASEPTASPTVASLEAADGLEALIQSALWTAHPVAVEPLPWPDPSAEPVSATTAAPLPAEPVAASEASTASGPVEPPEPVAASVAPADTAPVPVPRDRPARAPAEIVAVSAAAPAPPAPTEGPATVTIEGRVFACSVLSPALQARFASCGGAAESTIGTVEINGASVSCDRLTAALRGRFPSCGS